MKDNKTILPINDEIEVENLSSSKEIPIAPENYAKGVDDGQKREQIRIEFVFADETHAPDEKVDVDPF